MGRIGVAVPASERSSSSSSSQDSAGVAFFGFGEIWSLLREVVRARGCACAMACFVL